MKINLVFSNCREWGCGGKVGLLGGSSCTHTKTEFEQLSFIDLTICPFFTEHQAVSDVPTGIVFLDSLLGILYPNS